MTDSTYRLEGRVAAILNARELVINIGQEDGVLEGMTFAILAENPLEIPDPVTGATLDKLDREKVRVKASEVRRKVTVCRTYRTYTIPGLMPDVSRFREVYTKEIPETLRIEDSSVPAPLSEAESYVKVRDRVIMVRD